MSTLNKQTSFMRFQEQFFKGISVRNLPAHEFTWYFEGVKKTFRFNYEFQQKMNFLTIEVSLTKNHSSNYSFSTQEDINWNMTFDDFLMDYSLLIEKVFHEQLLEGIVVTSNENLVYFQRMKEKLTHQKIMQQTLSAAMEKKLKQLPIKKEEFSFFLISPSFQEELQKLIYPVMTIESFLKEQFHLTVPNIASQLKEKQQLQFSLYENEVTLDFHSSKLTMSVKTPDNQLYKLQSFTKRNLTTFFRQVQDENALLLSTREPIDNYKMFLKQARLFSSVRLKEEMEKHKKVLYRFFDEWSSWELFFSQLNQHAKMKNIYFLEKERLSSNHHCGFYHIKFQGVGVLVGAYYYKNVFDRHSFLSIQHGGFTQKEILHLIQENQLKGEESSATYT